VISEEARRLRMVKLLALADALDDVGMRARIIDHPLRSALLRCRDPVQMGPTLLVVCARTAETGCRWQFRSHPSGELIGGAEDVMHPDDAKDAALTITAALMVGRGPDHQRPARCLLHEGKRVFRTPAASTTPPRRWIVALIPLTVEMPSRKGGWAGSASPRQQAAAITVDVVEWAPPSARCSPADAL